MTPDELKAAITDEIWRTGITSDRNRAVLDLLGQAERVAEVVRYARMHEEADGVFDPECRLCQALAAYDAEVTA